MKKLVMKVGVASFIGASLMGSVLHVGSDTAQARPQYSKSFLAKYPSLTAAVEAKCAVCHEGETKKVRNEYGKAVGTALGAPKITDEAAITAALTKAEGEKSSSGKTFGELIKEGKLPAGK